MTVHPVQVRRRIRRHAASVRWLDAEIARMERRLRAMRRLSAYLLRRIDRARAELVDLEEAA